MSVTARAARRAVFATAGHVDHGKTALIRALTGTDTDRLPEEKRRGISIELGFAELALAEQGLCFIDVPGHRKLVHAMIAGASGVDALLLVVAADDGVMPQTREHLHVASLLGVHRVVVALTKRDLVDGETLALAEEEVRGTLSELGISPAGIVATSVPLGEGLDALRALLARVAQTVEPVPPTARSFLAVDRIFSVKGSGTVVTGTLTRGALTVGELLSVHGAAGATATACRGLQIHGRTESVASAPTRVAVNLSKLGTESIQRGDVLSSDPALPVTKRLDVSLRLLAGVEQELGATSPAVLHLGTTRVAARVVVLAPGLAHLTLEEPVVALGGLRLVLRGFSTDPGRGAVLGGGHVLDAEPDRLPSRRSREARAARAHFLTLARDGAFREAAIALLDLAAPRPLDAASIERRLGLEPGLVTTWFAGDAEARVVPLGGGRAWTTTSAIGDLSISAVALVEEHHARAPDDLGASLETLRSALAERAGRDAADLALARSVESGTLVVARGVVSAATFAAGRRGRVAEETALVEAALLGAGLEGADEAEVARRCGLTAAAIRSAVARLAAESRAHRLGGAAGLWFAESSLAALRAKLREHFRGTPALTIVAFKELAGISRKQAIPLLEQLDREGSTRREGDVRLAGQKLHE